MENAIRFTGPRGTVWVEADAKAGEIRVAVRDMGGGISLDQLPRLFEAPRRGDAPGQARVGVGLLMCRGIIEAYGGRIWCESTVGRGSAFFFTLPIT